MRIPFLTNKRLNDLIDDKRFNKRSSKQIDKAVNKYKGITTVHRSGLVNATPADSAYAAKSRY